MHDPRRLSLALLAAALVAPEAARAADLLEPEPSPAETYAESFTLSVDLGAGAYLQAQLAVSNLGPGDGQGACRVLFVPKPGAELAGAEKFDRDQWSYAKGAEPKFTVGPCSLTAAADALVFDARLKAGTVHVVLKAKPQRLSPPDHTVRIGGDFYETEILVPWAQADVQVDLQGAGGKAERSGFGFADHSRSTTLPGKLASRWVRFRVLDPSDAYLFLARFPAEGGAPQAWAWRGGQGAAVRVEKVKVGQKPQGQTPMFRALAMVGDQTWKMTSTQLLHRYAPVEKHGVLGAMVGSVVGNPITYTYVGQLEAGAAPRTGLMEVTVLQ
jgi:hypothetical protein